MATVIAFMNAYSEGLSGSDKVMMDYILKNPGSRYHVVTSKLGREACISYGVKANYIVTSRESTFSHVITTYVCRTLSAVWQTILRKPDLLFVSSDFLPDVLPAVIIKILHPKAKYLQKLHHLIPKNRPIPYYSQIASLYLVRFFADEISVTNEKLKSNLLSRFHFPLQKMLVEPPLINTDLINNSKPSKQKYSAVFMGQLRSSKGIFDLVPIWKQVCKKFPQSTLAIIGKDLNGNQKLLEEDIKKNNLQNNIKILGFLDSPTAYGLIKSSGLFILPSYEEGYGMVVAEAIACKAKVIAYDLPVFHEYFSNLVDTAPYKNIKIFSQKIIKHFSCSKN